MEEEMEAFQKRAEKQGGARWKARFVFFSFCFLCLQAPSAMAGGNLTNESFARAKRLLSQKVYMEHRVTLYCAASYDAGGNISLPEGFVAAQHSSRALRMEWEHIVPAENFGRSFREWREGHPLCTRDGKAFKGRSCAEKASKEYRRMHADMHNLAPAIGAVNAARKNHNFALLPEATSAFGSCPVKILGNKVEPPERARGLIARSYLYMQAAYPRYKMGRPQRQLMEAWNRAYPPDAWECTRARRIAALQGNANEVTERRCKEEGL
jgi:deoxyribonuclease-1